MKLSPVFLKAFRQGFLFAMWVGLFFAMFWLRTMAPAKRDKAFMDFHAKQSIYDWKQGK